MTRPAGLSRTALILTLPDTVQHYTFILKLARLSAALISPKNPTKLVSASMSLNEAPSQTEIQHPCFPACCTKALSLANCLEERHGGLLPGRGGDGQFRQWK